MKSEPFSISKYLPVLLLLVFLSFFAHLGSVPLFDGDEGLYSEVTREMMANNDFTTALLNGIPFFHKPPMFYWAQVASVNILGLNEFALRLPSAIAALLWVASIFLFTRRYYDTRTAWYGAFFMASSILVICIGRAATPEAMLNLFLTLTLLNIYRFYQSGNKRHIYWSFMFAALGVLTKGSIAILIPFAVSFTFFGLKKKWHDFMLLLCNPVGLIVFGLIVTPWYLAEYMRHGEAFLSEFLLFQWTENYTFIGSSLPYYSYIVLLIVGLLPNTALFIKATSKIRGLLADDLLKFMVIWFSMALLLLPLAIPRSIFALSYCCPPLFLIMARVAKDLRHTLNLFIGPLLFMALLFVVPFLAPYIMGSIDNEFTRIIVSEGIEYFDTFYLLTLGGVILLLSALPFIRPIPITVKYGILGLLFVGMVNFLVLPIMGNILQQPVKSAALQAKKEKLDVITWKINVPSFNVYAEMLTDEHTPKEGDIVLTKSAYLDEINAYEMIYNRQGIVLVQIINRSNR